MLRVTVSRQGHDGAIRRRALLRVGGAGLLGLTLPGWQADNAITDGRSDIWPTLMV